MKKYSIFAIIFLFFVLALVFFKNYSVVNIYEFPPLTGPYRIGSTSRHVIDTQRKDINNPLSHRELMVKIFYPIDKNEINNQSKREIYYKDDVEEEKKFLKEKGFPEKDIAMLDRVYTRAISGEEPLKDISFPVVLFSHGYVDSTNKNYTVFCEDLASHGYIVASILHTHYVKRVTFPDGHTVTAPENSAPHMPSEDEKKLWVDDAKTVLNYLEKSNADVNDSFYNSMNTQRIGMFGHSFGGAAAYILCLQDERFKAGVSLDGFLMIDPASIAQMKRPFMFILAQDTIDDLYVTDEQLAQRKALPLEQIINLRSNNQKLFANMRKFCEELQKTQKIKTIILNGIKHPGFSDLMILKEFPFYKNNKDIINVDTIAGDANGVEIIGKINREIAQFFKQNL